MTVATARKNNPVITYLDIEQGSEEWHIERDDNYSGSNAEKLLFDSKAKRITSGVITKYAAAERTGFAGNFYTKRGHVLEDDAIDIYEIKHKVSVYRPGIVKNSNYPGCIYSPDGIDNIDLKRILLEVKCFDENKHMEMYNGNIPLKIQAQIHYGMTITDLKIGILIIYNPRFAKKEFEDENGFVVPNPSYNPRYAYKEIIIRRNRDIHNNFNRILTA